MNANIPREVSKNKAPQTIGASQTAAPLTGAFAQTAGGSSKSFRMDILVGVVAISAGATAKHQHSNLPGLWTDAKTVAITASTDASAVVDSSTDQITIAGHGLSEDQPVAVSAVALPGGLSANQPYWVHVVDANTIQLKSANEGQIIDITSNGTTVKVTAVRAFSISYLPTVAGDQAHMPLRAIGRAVITTGAGDSVSVLKVIINQED